MAPNFVHLHLHTEYSLHDGLTRVKPLVQTVASLGMPACAVTDLSNVFAMVKFYRAAQAAGVKPIIGVDLWVHNEAEPLRPGRVTLLCRDQQGYRHLAELVTRCYTEGQSSGTPMLRKEWLKGRSGGLIALSGGAMGDVGQALLAGKVAQAGKLLDGWVRLFPDRYYLELRRTGRESEEDYLHAAVDLAAHKGAPVVATNSVQFLGREDFEAHEARVCIQEGRTLDDPRRPRRFTPEQYLKSQQEMAELFSDIPEAIENSVEIAKRCNLELTLGQNFLPDFPVPAGMNLPDYFRIQAEQGLEARLERLMAPSLFDPGVLSEERCRPYRERLAQEIEVITAMGFAGYFLIVADFIQWAKANGVPVGPGRGSGAGSLAAYALGITELDPLRYELLFERFLNPERVSLPDFDVDFCMEGRDRVIDYVAERYGRDRVSQIITYGSMAAKAVVRDVGRVLGYPYGFVDKIAKLIPFDLKMTLDKALEQEEELRRRYQQEDEVRALIDLAKALEGLTRNAGKHAGGVVIAPAPLTEFLPLYCEQGGANLVSQLDMEDVAELGLVKFDFLGLRTLTIIDWAVKIINADRVACGEPLLDITALPMDDAPTFELLKRCATIAVFQLESRGMKELIRRLQPDCFEDIVALVALFRPGPLQSGMVDDFINRKHGRAKVDYPHPLLEPILKPSYGVILYQEQVMQIAQVLAGYTLGGADLLRRAMGKKKPEEMAKQRAVFVSGSVERRVEQATATYIFDLMEKFAGYGFNRCVHGATRIIDADKGYETTVEELFNQRRPFRVHALGEDGELRIRSVTEVVWNGRKPVYELVTAQGKRIVVTANHPFRTLRGWTLLEDLRPGDRVAAPRCLPVATARSWLRHELIALAGLLSEGNTCHPSCLYFYGNDRTLVEDFAAAAAAFPNTVARIDERADGRLEVCVNTGRDTRFRPGNIPWNASRRFNGNAVVASDVASDIPLDRSGAFLWARNLGILGCKATEKFIPPEVYGLCDGDLELFLGRLWAGDGFIANATQTIPYYATSSEMLAKGTQTLLLRLGILSGLHRKQFKYRGGLRPGYTVYLIGETSVETFMARVAPHALGRERQVELLRRHLSSTRRGQTSKDTIPVEVRVWVDEERRKAGLAWSELEERSGTSVREFYGSGSSGKRGFRRAIIARLAEHLASERLAQLAHADVFWDTIVSIEPKGIADTYDLTVEGDHNFVANGLFVHNSHSAAYALLAYQTAWLKAHYPAAFMAAVLSADMDNTDKVVSLIEECREMQLKVLPPDINTSGYRFTVKSANTILYGLGAIKGVGEAALQGLLEDRAQNGPFRHLFELCRRIDQRKVNRRVLEALIKAGALDGLGPDPRSSPGSNRAVMMASLPLALQMAEQHVRDRTAGQDDLFGGIVIRETAEVKPAFVAAAQWSEEQRLAEEKETLGLYLTGHPIERHEQELARFTTARIAELKPESEQKVIVAGLVVAVRTLNARRGGRMAFVVLDDRSARIELSVFPELYQSHRDLLVKDRLLVIEGSVSPDDYSGGYRMSADRILDLNQARAAYAKRLVIGLDARRFQNGMVHKLVQMLTPFRDGTCPVAIDYRNEGACAQLMLGQEWRIRPTEELLHRLEELAGRDNVQLAY